MRAIGLLGKGGQAREIQSYCHDEDTDVVFHALSAEYLQATEDNEVNIESPTDEQKDTPVISAVGAPALKKEMVQAWPGKEYAKIISKSAYIAQDVTFGDGCVVAPLSSVGPNSSVGEHALVNVGATVPHDCTIGAYSTISPGVHMGGHVVIGAGCFIGIGAIIKNGITLADGTVVGAGAVVLNDVTTQNAVLVGVPAEVVKVNEGWLRAI